MAYATFIPFAFGLWLFVTTATKSSQIKSHLEAITAIPVYVVVMLSAIAAAYPPWESYRSIAIAGCLMLVPLQSVGWVNGLSAMIREPRVTCISCLLGAILYLYAYFHELLWQYMSIMASHMVSALASVFGISLQADMVAGFGMHLRSNWFGVKVFAPCSGIDGIALCLGLLSTVALLDWPTFRRFVLWRIYTLGMLVFVLANAVRITTLLLAGHAGSHQVTQAYLFAGTDPDIGRVWIRETVLMFFHEHIGWSFYVLVFYGLFRLLYSLPESSPIVRYRLGDNTA